eukprot:c43065_g1_i1 orf=268-3318(-)
MLVEMVESGRRERAAMRRIRCNELWRRVGFGLLWAMMVAGIWSSAADAETYAGDMAVLNELKSGMKKPELLQWDGDDACGGSWLHIQCQGHRVSGIQLANMGLEGTLPASLNHLTALANLGLQKNNFTGVLPSLRGLKNLRFAYLDDNQFDSIPSDFFKDLPALVAITLDHNIFNASSGGWTLSSDITASTQLQNLSLTNVGLTGVIPDFLGAMPSLQVLHLAYNKLGGGIPATFSTCNLRVFQVNNQMGPVLSGPIDVVGSMHSLSQLWLHVNKFSGTIPTGISNALSLTDIKLNDNDLKGPIPWGLRGLFLTVFTVQNNHLDGPIPPIQVARGGNFNVENNLFCHGTPGLHCSPSVTSLLEFLSSVNYPLSLVQSWVGNDPCVTQWIGITCQGGSVSVLNLANSKLSGTISPFLSNVTSLSAIELRGNNLTGTIPNSLTSLKLLRILDVRNNQLSGSVPRFSHRVQVSIEGNPLANGPPASGSQSSTPPSIPEPAPLAPLPSTPNSKTPTAAPPMASRGPSSLFPTPPTGSSNSNANSSGASSETGSASKNNTTQPVSTKTSSSSVAAVAGSVLGVVILLLFVPLVVFLVYKSRRKKTLRVQSPDLLVIRPRDDSSDPEMVKAVVAGRNFRTSDTVQSRESSGPGETQVIEAGNLVISVQVLRNVTDNFSEQNILGKGGFGIVYKGELHDGTMIAVKRMEAAMVRSKGLNEFQAEIAVLTKVRHRHLVALLGYCIDGDERLLVYEYMPMGTLSKHLFDWAKQKLKPLDWKRRLTIALDVARGMEYLHGLAHKSFIHRDLKPSNILLGDDYRAKVSDFGLVKLAPDNKHSVETRLAGTFGYMAPEYAATGRVTTKSDVFSFGVVLMELITGRRALDESQPEQSMHLVSWFRRMYMNKGLLMNAFDSALEITEESFQSICIVAELAGHCTTRASYQRPDMSHAVGVLAPLVQQWKPTDQDSDECGGIDLEMTLPQALKKWQAYEDFSVSRRGLDDTVGSLPTWNGFAESFTSSDAR